MTGLLISIAYAKDFKMAGYSADSKVGNPPVVGNVPINEASIVLGRSLEIVRVSNTTNQENTHSAIKNMMLGQIINSSAVKENWFIWQDEQAELIFPYRISKTNITAKIWILPDFSRIKELLRDNQVIHINRSECRQMATIFYRIGYFGIDFIRVKFDWLGHDYIPNYSYPWAIGHIELLRAISDRLSSQTPLPQSNSSVNNYSCKRKPFEPHFLTFKSRIFLALGLVCGVIFFALGIVLLFHFWRRVGLDRTANQNFMFGFSLVTAVGFIWVGQWILFSVFGLMP